MVLFHFKFLHPLLKPKRHCFGFLDECGTLHSECCTLWISILRTAITVVSFRVTGAITSQNEALGKFYGLDGCKPSTDSFKPKKGYPNLNRVSQVFWPSFFHHMKFYVKTGSRLLVFDLPSLESGSPWYVPFQIPAPTSKSRTALFRLFGRTLHLAQRMLHPVDIDSSDDHNCWLV